MTTVRQLKRAIRPYGHASQLSTDIRSTDVQNRRARADPAPLKPSSFGFETSNLVAANGRTAPSPRPVRFDLGFEDPNLVAKRRAVRLELERSAEGLERVLRAVEPVLGLGHSGDRAEVVGIP